MTKCFGQKHDLLHVPGSHDVASPGLVAVMDYTISDRGVAALGCSWSCCPYSLVNTSQQLSVSVCESHRAIIKVGSGLFQIRRKICVRSPNGMSLIEQSNLLCLCFIDRNFHD